jgi:hypothetical protein
MQVTGATAAWRQDIASVVVIRAGAGPVARLTL